MPRLVELVGDAQRAVAADADEGVELHLVEHLHHAVGVVERALGRFDRHGERVAAVDRAEDGAAQAQDAGDVLGAQRPGHVRIDEAVEAVLEAEDSDPRVAGGLHHRADHRVQAGGIPTAGEHTDLLHRGHLEPYAHYKSGSCSHFFTPGR